MHKGSTSWSLQDVTVDVLNALELLTQMREIQSHPHWTEKNLAAAIYGERIQDFRVHGVTALKGFGCHFPLAGRDATTSEILEFILTLIHRGIISEYKLDFSKGHVATYSHYYIKVLSISDWDLEIAFDSHSQLQIDSLVHKRKMW